MDRYQLLKVQMEMAGVIDKGAIDKDPRVCGMLRSIFSKPSEPDLNLSDEERLGRYLKIRNRLSHYGIMWKKEADWEMGIQEHFQNLLFNQFSQNISNEEKLLRFTNFYGTMIQEKMIPPELMKKIIHNEKLKIKIGTAFGNRGLEKEAREGKEKYQELKEKIIAIGINI